MRKTLFAPLAAACVLASLLSASAKIHSSKSAGASTTSTGRSTGLAGQKQGPQLPPEEIIRQFTKKESELLEIWKEYSYLQESKIQTIGAADTITGEFYQVSEFVFNDAGRRIERIIKAPQSTLYEVSLTPEDRNAFINLQPFALTAEELPNYFVSFVGREKVDELNTYVFDVIPRVMSNQRELDRLRKQKIEGKFFQGKIWVDDVDLQIVKTSGKIAPEFEQRFVKFETYRENIDERYWFPTYTFGDERLFFPKGGSARVRMIVKYKNYRRFSSDVKLLDVEEVKGEGDKAPAGTPEAKPGDAKAGEAKKDDTKKEEAGKTKQRPRP
ncbi:MAG: hypothetical protein L0Y75_10175 [Acidobacteria bacterium]|nr:hypothetical protein [Acidobacteriota bacterium]